MDDAERFRLLGVYATPRFRYGEVLTCERRGDVVVTGLTDAPIPWPVGCRVGRGRRCPSIVLCGDLAEAVRRESAQAVAHWWGVTPQIVTRWRRTLGVPQNNAGTTRLRRDYTAEPWAAEARRLAHAKARDPGRREKIAASMRGKARPPEMMERLRQGNLGRKATPEARARLSEVHRSRGTRPPKAGRPWTAEEDALVAGGMGAPEVARRTGRTLSAVYCRRSQLGVNDGRAARWGRPAPVDKC